MKQTYQSVLIAAVTCALFACGSSGSGSGATAPDPVVDPNPVVDPDPVVDPNPVVDPDPVVEKYVPGTAIVNYQYVYKAANGQEYDFTLPGLSDAVVKVGSNSNTAGLSTGNASFAIGGAGYTSTRFGAYASADGTRDVFVAGTPTRSSDVPTTGVGVYHGSAVRALAVDSVGSDAMTFLVDFDEKIITGKSDLKTGTPEATFGAKLALDGEISGSSFSGKATSDGETGDFKGNFFGPAAEELAGTANFANWKLNAAFGGRKK